MQTVRNVLKIVWIAADVLEEPPEKTGLAWPVPYASLKASSLHDYVIKYHKNFEETFALKNSYVE